MIRNRGGLSMRSRFAGCALAAAALVCTLAGCELLKHDADAQARVSARVLGMAAGDFFDRYGRARTRREATGGMIEYDWISAVGFARPGVEGLDQRVCRLHLVADARGRIERVDVLYDAPGNTSTSRCGEIFAAP
jgi:hypothetical protein